MITFDSTLESWAPYVDGRRHALAIAIGAGRFAIAVARRDDVPVVVAAHSHPYDGSVLPIISRVIPAAAKYGARSVWMTETTHIDLQHPALRIQRVESLQLPEGPNGPKIDGRALTPAPRAVSPCLDTSDATLMLAVSIASFVAANQYPRPLSSGGEGSRGEHVTPSVGMLVRLASSAELLGRAVRAMIWPQ